jgi:putative hemin transport protein
MQTTAPQPPALKAEHRFRSPADLQFAWKALLDAEPRLRIREAAARLRVSEMDLVALNRDGTTTPLRNDWIGLLSSLAPLGELMALTRNDHAVHELHGHYRDPELTDSPREVVFNELGLRLLVDAWRHGFAVTEKAGGSARHSLQFFDSAGTAVHKIYVTERSHLGAYEDLVERHAAAEPFLLTGATRGKGLGGLSARPPAHAEPLLTGGRLTARPVERSSVEHIMRLTAEIGMPLLVVVPSPAAVQTYAGLIHNIKRTGPWINILDARFSLHLRDAEVASVWVVRETSTTGVSLSLALYDTNGGLIARFLSVAGSEADDTWQDLLGALPTLRAEEAKP